MASNDPLRIKARAADLGVTMKDICAKMLEEGVECHPNNLSRARNRECKTARDWELINAADAVLKKLEQS